METSFKYELKIKGRKADIGSKLLFLDGKKYVDVNIADINVGNDGICSVSIKLCNKPNTPPKWFAINGDKYFGNIEDFLFWEKPIIYQLPDTEGNLSEVKVGQEVFSESDTKMYINKLENNIIYVQWDGCCIQEYENITGESRVFYSIKTNKPKRDFSPYFDFNQAPKGYDFGAVDDDGYAWWFKDKPNQLLKSWNVDNYNFESAGFRQNLVNPETGCVDDWKDSLVKRIK